MADEAFQQVWQKVAALEGSQFRTAPGAVFTYRFHKTYVVVSSGNLSVPRTFFQKIFQRMQENAPGNAPPLQGQTYIQAILADPRVREDA
jgi:hypothetical protein